MLRKYMTVQVTAQGTSAAETALCDVHNDERGQRKAAMNADTDVTHLRMRVTNNDELACIVCGWREVV